MSLDSKGQASAELILATVVFMVIALSLFQLVSSGMDKTDSGNLGQVRMIGESVAETINTVYINGPGYSANITLPSSPANYTVNVNSNGNLSVLYHTNNITIKLIPTKITSSGAMTSGTTHQVTNNNGTIKFT